MLAILLAPAAGGQTGPGGQPGAAAPKQAEVLTGAAAFHDYRGQAPGLRRRITAADLPAPNPGESVDRGPHLVPRPPGAMPLAPPGFAVSIYASGLEGPRLLRFAPNGDLFVAESMTGTIKVLRGRNPDGTARQVGRFASGLNQPFGIAFYPSGPRPQWVYVGTEDQVLRYPYHEGDLEASAPAQHVADLPGKGGHWTRDVVFSQDGTRLFVSVGSRSNADDPDTHKGEFHRADVLAFTPEGSFVKVYASGIRNCVGEAIEPGTGALWCSTNERDGLGNNLVPDYITHVEEDGFYGWPYYYIGSHPDPRHAGKHPELAARVLVPDVLLQAHSASLELAFYEGAAFPAEYRGHAFAAEHGSWNREGRTGYEVIRVPVEQGRASGEYQDFLTGFVTPAGDVWGRPVGVAVGPDGALYVSDDAANVIWRVAWEGSGPGK